MKTFDRRDSLLPPRELGNISAEAAHQARNRSLHRSNLQNPFMSANYSLPLPVLRGYLGPSTITEFESPQTAGAFHRAWRCGCIAQYRNSAHQTAVWRPCALHRAQPAEGAAPATPPISKPHDDGAERRSGTNFCIIDSQLNVLCKSSGSEVVHLMGLVRDAVACAVAEGAAAVVPVDAHTVLRMMPLQGDPVNSFAVVVEGRRGRSQLADAATRYQLTRRETEVLRLLLAHRTNNQISEALCIAEGTVSDHVKSLFRKTDSNRRTELLTKLFLI
jgi:DNA-binding CsgD family transcriptional regulator